jgi:A/G-specific adenine glycosylase
MLMIQDPDGAVLLERRPTPGIWGGLWCFPQIDVDEDPIAAVAARLQLPAGEPEGSQEAWGAFTHQFTHFRLQVTPLRIRLQLRPDNVRDGGSDWFDPASAADVGLAAPVKRLLAVLATIDLARPTGDPVTTGSAPTRTTSRTPGPSTRSRRAPESTEAPTEEKSR